MKSTNRYVCSIPVAIGLIWTVFMPPALCQEQNCSTSRSGVPACNFNIQSNPFCGWTEKYNRQAWVSTSEITPVQAYEGSYIYLDHYKSSGQQTFLEAQISAGVPAICVKFFYATNGQVSDPIRFFLVSDNDDYQLMHETYPNPYDSNIYLKWQSDDFSCCLPNVDVGTRKIALSAVSKLRSNVALDFIDIRRSEMKCTGDNLVCYPTPGLTTQVTSRPITTATPKPDGSPQREKPDGSPQRALPPQLDSSSNRGTYHAAAIGGGIAAAVVVVALVGGGFYWKTKHTGSSSSSTNAGSVNVESVYNKGNASNGQSKEEPVGFDNVVYSP